MAEYYFYANFDTDNAYFGDDPLFDHDEYWADAYDPAYYSRLAAQCNRCRAEYKNLYRAVSATARAARNDGWQIEKTEKGCYEWYCPKCRATHDFEEARQ
jgi:hypothetical protein